MSAKELQKQFEKSVVLKRLKEMVAKINASKGMTTVEYAMMVVFIACVACLGFELLGGSVKSLFNIANQVLPK